MSSDHPALLTLMLVVVGIIAAVVVIYVITHIVRAAWQGADRRDARTAARRRRR